MDVGKVRRRLAGGLALTRDRVFRFPAHTAYGDEAGGPEFGASYDGNALAKASRMSGGTETRDLERQLQAARAELERVYASKSWRYTSALRSLRRSLFSVPEPDPPKETGHSFSEEEFRAALCDSDSFRNGSDGRREYIGNSVPRLYRIMRNMKLFMPRLEGPTLDVASGAGLLFPALRRFYPECLPYSVAEMKVPGQALPDEFVYDGVKVPVIRFHCEKDRLDVDPGSYGAILFLDTLEHLIVDPIWTGLEFNRALRLGGTVVISTPNAGSASHMMRLLNGHNPTTESVLKPTALYQRHNREWILAEVVMLLECCGFSEIFYSTNADFMESDEHTLLDVLEKDGFLKKPRHEFGPEIFVKARKTTHRTLDDDLPDDLRWPQWLYSSYEAYRKRPDVFPVVVSSDYA